jgi:hypothetical protein
MHQHIGDPGDATAGTQQGAGMDATSGSRTEGREPQRYEIRVKGRLDIRWAAWFEGMSLTHAADGTTALSGMVVDQSALHGLLQKLRDLGVPLISVSEVAETRRRARKARERRTE